ncbi:ogr/Delta-like zinc finger family protein [Sphingomonas sp. M6A6_1c]
MTKPIDRTRLPGIKCPHCKNKTIVRDSQELTPSVRELRIVCTDDDCGFSCVAQLSLIRQIRASAKPNPDIRLPFGHWPAKPANENHPDPANDADEASEKAAIIGDALASIMTT